jgi:small subunit ribosomal protein S15
MLTTKKKANVISTTARHAGDTGSPDVQVAVLTRRIEDLTKHLRKNTKDIHSRRGLLQMVADRRSHLRYLENNDKRRYNAVIKKLGLKK